MAKQLSLDRPLDDFIDGGRKRQRDSDRRPRDDRPPRRWREEKLDRPLDWDTYRKERPTNADRAKAEKDKEKHQKKRKRDDDEDTHFIGRGGRLVEKFKPTEVQKAKGRGEKTHGTFSRPRTVKITNIAPIVEWEQLKELFEGAAGKIVEGDLQKNGTAFITFEKPNAAATATFEFNGGELADKKIKVQLVYDDSDED
eukprot:TRINITY_DN83979_c0_g1_i1.p1 TRINITY_DN83979_c0_g1~~TRINITY_DN83979_c0_g1_i1.p1  ORF type:complete len:198 (+),score=59.28 TRINITY_DN83979_c0_g1_i1:84-677(+)